MKGLEDKLDWTKAHWHQVNQASHLVVMGNKPSLSYRIRTKQRKILKRKPVLNTGFFVSIIQLVAYLYFDLVQQEFYIAFENLKLLLQNQRRLQNFLQAPKAKPSQQFKLPKRGYDTIFHQNMRDTPFLMKLKYEEEERKRRAKENEWKASDVLLYLSCHACACLLSVAVYVYSNIEL